jgi:hypothetical protein
MNEYRRELRKRGRTQKKNECMSGSPVPSSRPAPGSPRRQRKRPRDSARWRRTASVPPGVRVAPRSPPGMSRHRGLGYPAHDRVGSHIDGEDPRQLLDALGNQPRRWSKYMPENRSSPHRKARRTQRLTQWYQGVSLSAGADSSEKIRRNKVSDNRFPAGPLGRPDGSSPCSSIARRRSLSVW